MLKRFFPTEKDFFGPFAELTQELSGAVQVLLDVLENPAQAQAAIARSKKHESQAELLVRRGAETLYESYVTPFERRHLFHFFMQLGQMTTSARLTAQKLVAYEVGVLPVELTEIALEGGEACKVLKQLVAQLPRIQHPHEALRLCLSMYRIRAKAQTKHFEGSLKIFREDVKTSMKLKELADDLVSLVLKFETLSLLVEEIILEYA